MRCPTAAGALNPLLLTLAPSLTARQDTYPEARPYTDIDTNITFYGHAPPSGYRFGMVLPEEPTGDVILQIVAPLQDGAGWGGVSFGSSMIGPLLFATW